MRKYRRLIVIGIILGLLAFIVVTLLSDVSQLVKTATTFAWAVMIPVLGLRMTNWALRFLKWHYYLWLVGVRNISLRDSASVFISGMTLAASPGKAAEILKSFIVKAMTGAPVATTLPVVAAERLSDGIAVLILLSWAALNLADGRFWPLIGIGMAIIAVGIVILQIRPLCLRLLALLIRLPVLGRFARDFSLFYESSYKIVSLPSLIIAVTLGTVANGLDGLALYLILTTLGLPAIPDTFFRALVTTSSSVVAGSVSGSPGGIGASDLTIAGTLSTVVGLKDTTLIGFVTLLARFAQLWWGVFIGGLVMVLDRKRLFPSNLDAVIAEEERALGSAELQPVSGK